MSDLNLALSALIGGGVGSLDAIDGAILNDGDAAVVVLSTGVYHYHLNAASGAAENSPYVIAPDSNPGTKRWVLVTPMGPFSHVNATSNATQSVPTGVATKLNFGTEDYDLLSEFASSEFTALYTGYYSVKAYAVSGQMAWASTEYAQLRVYVDTVLYKSGARFYLGSGTERIIPTASWTVKLLAGEVLDIRILHSQGGNVDFIAGTFVSIDRIA